MPRIKRDLKVERKPHHPGLVKKLAEELKSEKQFGQPRIEETPYTKSGLRVMVFWDKWASVPDHERADVILQAYEFAEGREYRERIVVALGLTYRDAWDLGLLPYKLEPTSDDADGDLDKEICKAMYEEGASKLFRTKRPELRFASKKELEDSRKRLQERFPEYKDNWLVTKEISSRDN